MLRYFPTNYVWNLTINIALMMGAKIGDIVRVCDPLMDMAKHGDDEGTDQFFYAWMDEADKIVSYAERDEGAGHPLSAAVKYRRAAILYIAAERMQRCTFGPRKEAYAKGVATFRKSIELANEPCEFIDVPYGSSSYPALFVAAEGVKGKAPCMVFCNGLDSLKEMGYCSDIAKDLPKRGISVLFIDQPGTGGAIRDKGLHGFHDAERWASPAVDYLEQRDDVDSKRIGMMGWSLGGYFAPRAAAFEPRFSLCVSWGANYTWGKLQEARLNNEGDRPVPHYWEHVQWVFDKPDLKSFLDWAPNMTLEGVMENIRVPYLLTHGERDTQIPFTDADKQFKGVVNSPKAELKIFTAEEGGAAHASADNPSVGSSFIADWVQENI